MGPATPPSAVSHRNLSDVPPLPVVRGTAPPFGFDSGDRDAMTSLSQYEGPDAGRGATYVLD
jgi:hypothetical protein